MIIPSKQKLNLPFFLLYKKKNMECDFFNLIGVIKNEMHWTGFWVKHCLAQSFLSIAINVKDIRNYFAINQIQHYLGLKCINHLVLIWNSEPEVVTSLPQGGLTEVVREHWAHTSLSPLHRTTAVGAGKAAAQGDPAGSVHQQIQGASVSPTLSRRRTLPERTYKDISQGNST